MGRVLFQEEAASLRSNLPGQGFGWPDIQGVEDWRQYGNCCLQHTSRTYKRGKGDPSCSKNKLLPTLQASNCNSDWFLDAFLCLPVSWPALSTVLR